MNPNLLTPERIAGYFKVKDVWTTPTLTGGNGGLLDINGVLGNPWQYNRAPPGANAAYEIYAVTDPMSPSVYLGSVLAVNQDGRSFYDFATQYGAEGEPLVSLTWIGETGTSDAHYSVSQEDGSVSHAELSRVASNIPEVQEIYIVSNGLRLSRIVGPTRGGK